MNESILNQLSKYTLLFVENEKGIRENFQEFFNLLFKKVYVAVDGVEALEVFNNSKPDLIITDIKMPNMDGIELVKSIREVDSKVSIVIISAHTDVELLLSSIPLNLIEYIVKPLNQNKLFEIFEIFLSKHKNKSEYIFNKDKNQISIDGTTYSLSYKENIFLDKLINGNKVVTYDEIEFDMWDGKPMSQNALRLFIKNLRKKLSVDFIKNIANQGYILNH
ncbi:MAG: response regulator [Campylobacterota bacterium]|nr:response regulator [Campylobacterota bacterium]